MHIAASNRSELLAVDSGAAPSEATVVEPTRRP